MRRRIDHVPSAREHSVEAGRAAQVAGLCGYRMGHMLDSHGKLTTIPSPASLADPICQSTAYNPAGLIAARIGLGFFETGFGPAIPLYFCRCSSQRSIAIITLLIHCYSILVHERRAGAAPGLLARVRRSSRCVWRADCVWHPARTARDFELEAAVHSRGSFGVLALLRV